MITKKTWRSFSEAREYARSLCLSRQLDWFALKDNRPKDIPCEPNKIYKDHWVNWGDWLGTGYIATAKRIYRSFHEAREFVRMLGIKNSYKAWSEYVKSGQKPEDIPATPNEVYAGHGWTGWSDWLGNGSAKKTTNLRSFTEARTFTRSLELTSNKQWRKLWKTNKLPVDLPSDPRSAYKNEWISWPDFLGKKYSNFNVAREYVQSLNIPSCHIWRNYCDSGKLPNRIPHCPDNTYTEWAGWGDWFGTSRIANQCRVFRTFVDARKFVQSLGLTCYREWSDYCKSGKKPDDIPANPSSIYKDNGWLGVGDWLGTGAIANYNKIFKPFAEAKEIARSLKFVSKEDWRAYCKSGNKSVDVPNRPDHVYKDEWISWNDWFGSKWKNKKQRLMYKFLCEIYYPDANEKELHELVRYNKFHQDLHFKSGFKMQLDVWMPKCNTAYEYQGEQHYGRRKDLQKNFQKIASYDYEKREACHNKGINLILVDYRWDGTKAMLEKYINGQIKPLVVKEHKMKQGVVYDPRLRAMGAVFSSKVWSIGWQLNNANN